MVESVGRVSTGQPQRYVKQLVSHLGHKVSTAMSDDGIGTLTFSSGGVCTLTPADGELVLVATAEDDEELSHVRDVVGRHLERFGGREELRVRWSE